MTAPDVHIVGGGLAGLTVAFHLSEPAVRDRFGTITVYEMSNRLGGKGASTRGEGGRIEEHGLHVWFGYYENAFRLLDRCHTELDRLEAAGVRRWPGPTSVERSFRPASTIGLVDDQADGSWLQWWTVFPEDDLAPWDRDDLEQPAGFDLLWYLPLLGERSAQLLAALLVSLTTDTPATNLNLADVAQRAADVVRGWSEPLGRLLEAVFRAAFRLRQAAAAGSGENVAVRAAEAQLKLLDQALDHIRDVADVRVTWHATARRLLAVVDLLVGVTRGLLRFGISCDEDFDDLDDWELDQWLSDNGVLPESRDCSLVRALAYSLPLAYEGGDREAPCFSAGVGLRLFLRCFFTYRGALMWKMTAGMGEVVFLPLYELICKRGIGFKFGHQLVGVGTDGDRVAELVFARSADLPPQTETVDDRTVWAGRLAESAFEPDSGDRHKHREPVDGALVVLAMPIEALKWAAPALFDRPRWQQMREIGTVASTAAQLWLEEPVTALGWPDDVTASGFSEPLDTFADMSHLVAVEGRSERGLIYLCSASPEARDRPLPRGEREYLVERPRPPSISGRQAWRPGATSLQVGEWLTAARQWARSDLALFQAERAEWLWPRAYERFGADLPRVLGLLDAEEWLRSGGPPRLDEQRTYVRVNTDPSDRYTLSLPGTLRYRMDPWDTGFENLYVAGDWTRCLLNAGCIEAATISGMLAAEAISGRTLRIIGRRS